MFAEELNIKKKLLSVTINEFFSYCFSTTNNNTTAVNFIQLFTPKINWKNTQGNQGRNSRTIMETCMITINQRKNPQYTNTSCS